MAINIPIISRLEGKGFQQAITQLKALETTSQKAGYIAGKAFLPAVAAMGALTVAAGYSIKAAVEDSAAQALIGGAQHVLRLLSPHLVAGAREHLQSLLSQYLTF